MGSVVPGFDGGVYFVGLVYGVYCFLDVPEAVMGS